MCRSPLVARWTGLELLPHISIFWGHPCWSALLQELPHSPCRGEPLTLFAPCGSYTASGVTTDRSLFMGLCPCILKCLSCLWGRLGGEEVDDRRPAHPPPLATVPMSPDEDKEQ